MTQFVGFDVLQKDVATSVVDDGDRQIWRGNVKTDPIALAAVIVPRAPDAERIGFETRRSLGLVLACIANPRSSADLSGRAPCQGGAERQSDKTDENDALGLAQLVRIGWYREVKVKSLESQLVRGVLGVRAQLVSTRFI